MSTLVKGLIDTLNSPSFEVGDVHIEGKGQFPWAIRWSSLGKPLVQLQVEKIFPLPTKVLHTPTRYFGYLAEEYVRYALDQIQVEYQREVPVVLENIRGSVDFVLDGVVLEVKCVSQTTHKKIRSFSNQGKLTDLVPYGYPTQLSAYSRALGNIPAYWIVFDKSFSQWYAYPLPTTDVVDQLLEAAVDKIGILNTTNSAKDIHLVSHFPDVEVPYLQEYLSKLPDHVQQDLSLHLK